MWIKYFGADVDAKVDFRLNVSNSVCVFDCRESI